MMLASALTFATLLLADPALVEVRLRVPVGGQEITGLRLGGKPLAIKSIRKTADANRLVVLDLSGQQNRRLLYEWRAAALLCPEFFANVQVLETGGEYAKVTKASLGASPPPKPMPEPERHDYGVPQAPSLHRNVGVLESIADHYRGRGPVDVIWVGEDLWWLDGRGDRGWLNTPIECFWDAIGDAGLTLYPVAHPRRDRAWVDDKFVRSLFGAPVRLLTGKLGEALVAALRDSRQSTEIVFEVPASKGNWRGIAPKLEVLGKNGHVLLKRPFAAGGTVAPYRTGETPMADYLFRVIP